MAEKTQPHELNSELQEIRQEIKYATFDGESVHTEDIRRLKAAVLKLFDYLFGVEDSDDPH